MTQSVGNNIFTTSLIGNHECVLLEILNPLGMSHNKFSLGIEERHGLVVTVQNQLFVEEVIPPLHEGLNDYIELIVVCGVSLLHII